jgi:hypothetical protein
MWRGSNDARSSSRCVGGNAREPFHLRHRHMILIACSTPAEQQLWSAILYVTGEAIRGLLILKPKSVTGARTSPPRQSLPVVKTGPCGRPSDRAS